ncbi:MAG: glycosyltransferase family 4 protein [Ferruginibacter sp.]
MTTIFICIDWFHPAYKAGGPVQSIANLVNNYQQTGVRFKIFCSNADLDGKLNEGVAFDEWTFYNACTQVWFASKTNRTVATIQREINNSNAGVLFIIGIYSWYFNLLPLLFCKVPVKIISARGMLHPGALTQKSFKKKIYIAFWKMARIHLRYRFHATDAREKEIIQGIFGNNAKVTIAGNFPRSFAFQNAPQKKAGALELVSIAVLSPMKNIALVLEALKDCKPAVNYAVFGPVKDAVYWQHCLSIIDTLPAHITAVYRQDLVPSKIEDALKGYEVFILPSKSENFGHAIFEALSAGKPVITSHHTPFNELCIHQAGQNVSLDNTAEMTAAIDFFAAMDCKEFAVWNYGAQHYKLKNMDLQGLKEQYDQLFNIK